MKISLETLKRMLEGSNNDDEIASLNEVSANMAQVFSVLLVIFIMAYAITSASSAAQVKDAKATAKHYRDEHKKINKAYDQLTADKEAVDKLYARVKQPKKKLEADRNIAVENLQKEILYVQVDRYDAEQRNILALSAFSVKSDNALTFDLTDIISNDGKVINKRFIDGSKKAIEFFTNEKWSDLWLADITIRANIQLKKNALAQMLDTITDKNKLWLDEEIKRRITQMEKDAINLQWEATTYLLAYYSERSDKIEDPEISNFRNQYRNASAEVRQTMIPQLMGHLKNYVRLVFTRSGATLLDDVFEI